MNYINESKINFVVVGIILLFGSYIAIDRGSNFSDGDSYGVILSFLDFIDKGVYNPSRGAYGYPIPEFLIGNIAYFFGTPYSNLFCFFCFIISNFFFYKTFIKENKYLNLYILLVCSNFYLFFENTNSIDYPIALLFFSLGLFFLKRSNLFLASFLFALCMGSRAIFGIFIYPIILIYFYKDLVNKKIRHFFYCISIITIIGLTFYFPVFHANNFTLDFLDLPFLNDTNVNKGKWFGGPQLTLESLLPRFIFKIYKLIGIFSIIIFLFYIKKYLNFFLSLKKDNLIISSIIFFNLVFYFFMPTKLLLINPLIIFIYLISIKILKKNIIYALVFLNLSQWFVAYDIIDIKYKYSGMCDPVVAVDAKIKFSIKKGNLIDYFTNKKNYKICYVKFLREYSDNFKNDLPLKIK